ncbi:Gfo/Idh/MocA family protein [Anaerocolumna sp. MB42-C2]|uniref:Gfo/Idh/MocA family protein n=1 Tax=Anaerocolumna sp. MB42-C2 TaxID=3070997 RepID=UPI0027E207AB|nr:Gfo/Idh/MocA family oxidoreductase [Anaerocolumna sp. MB42-C2]WMJ85615.1 Gfo/Idh/MocA family oxidoreductase [Anaerocolumna sp. MB42-C2]
MGEKVLRIGVIGTGFIGKQHIEAIRRIPGAEVVAVADSNGEMVKSVSEQLHIPSYYSDYTELLKKKDIDIVHNCTPSALHFEINKAVMKSGKHVYCEKPLTLNTKESEELVQLSKEKGIAAGANFNYRHNAMVQEMHERVKNNSIGEILVVHGQYLQDWLLYDTDYDWRLDPKLGGESRAVSDIGSHCFDTMQYILNKKIISVYANLITVYPIRKRTEKVGGTYSNQQGKVLEEVSIHSEDVAFIMIKFENGTQGLINLSQVGAGKKNGLSVTISGSTASLEWEQERPDKLWVGHRDSGNEEIYASSGFLTGAAKRYALLPNGHPLGWTDALKCAIQSFYEAILHDTYQEDKQNYATFADGHYIMKLVEACLISSQHKEWVDIQ